MKRSVAAAYAGILLASVAARPTALHAQGPEGWVATPGVVRLSVEGITRTYDERFGGGGTASALAAPLLRPLDAETFAPVRVLSRQLGAFFAGTQGGAPGSIDLETLTLGTPDVRFADSEVRVPLRLSLGVAPRVEIGAEAVLERRERLLQRIALDGGTIGENPDPTANSARLSQLGPQWADLGRSTLLPTESSPLGVELQRRVAAAGVPALRLPGSPADSALFQKLLVTALDVRQLSSRVGAWRPGDVEVFARVLLLSTFGAAPFPPDSAGVSIRVTARGAARVPTGAAGDPRELLAGERDAGRSGATLALGGDLFSGSRFWAAAGARFSVVRGGTLEQRAAPPESPLGSPTGLVPVSVDPGDELEIRVSPRYRLAPVIALGLEYGMLWTGATTFTGAEGALPLEQPGGALHRLGAGIRYTTLPGITPGPGGIGVEVGLAHARTLSGPPGAPRGGLTTITASVLAGLWGRRAP